MPRFYLLNCVDIIVFQTRNSSFINSLKSAHHTSNQTNINVMGNSKQHQCKNGGQSKIFKTLTCVIRLALVNQLQKCISKFNALKLNRTCFISKYMTIWLIKIIVYNPKE